MSSGIAHKADALVGKDYANSPVPEHARYTSARVGVTMGAWIIAMSTFFTGGVLASGLSFWDAALAALIGQTILAVIGFLTALVGGRRRLSMAMIQIEIYGSTVGRLIALTVAFILGIGWFAWQLSFFGQTIQTSFGGHALTTQTAAMIWGAAVTTVTVLFGFRLLSFVSMVAVPAIIGLSFYGLFLSINQAGGFSALLAATPAGEPLSMIKAIGLVVGAAIGGTVMVPDLSRFARNPVRGAAAASMSYAVAGFIILLCGAAIVYAARVPAGDLPGAMQAVGLGLPAFIILIVAQWATNKSNLYSGVLCFVALTGWKQSLVVVALGFLGLLVALAGIHEKFVPLLTFLGNFMPPIAGAMVMHFLVLRGDSPSSPLTVLAVLAGGSAGYIAEYLQLEFPSSLVAFSLGAIVHYLLARCVPRVGAIASAAAGREA
jgi:cytosine permease